MYYPGSDTNHGSNNHSAEQSDGPRSRESNGSDGANGENGPVPTAQCLPLVDAHRLTQLSPVRDSGTESEATTPAAMMAPPLVKMPELPMMTKEDLKPPAGGDIQEGKESADSNYIPIGYTGPPCPPPDGSTGWAYPPFCFGPPPPDHPAWKMPPWINWESAPPSVKQLKVEMLEQMKAEMMEQSKSQKTPENGDADVDTKKDDTQSSHAPVVGTKPADA